MPMFGVGFANKLGLAGDILTGNPVTQNRLQQQQADALRLQQAQAEQQRLNRPQIINSGDGQVLSVDPMTGGIKELQAARPPQPHIGETQQLIEQWNGLPADDPRRPLIERAIRGYQYSAPVMEQRQSNALGLIDARASHQAALKAQPTYSALHPRSPMGGGVAPAPSATAGVSTADLLAALRRH